MDLVIEGVGFFGFFENGLAEPVTCTPGKDSQGDWGLVVGSVFSVHKTVDDLMDKTVSAHSDDCSVVGELEFVCDLCSVFGVLSLNHFEFKACFFKNELCVSPYPQ